MPNRRKDEKANDKENYGKVFECAKKNQSKRFSFSNCQKELNEYLAS